MIELLYLDTLLKGLFYGLNVAISIYLIFIYIQTRRAIVLNAGIFVMLMAAFLAIIDIVQVIRHEFWKINPKDKAASIFLKRSAHLMITGVPEDWSGVDEGMSLIDNDIL
jgi:hypothetical protein